VHHFDSDFTVGFCAFVGIDVLPTSSFQFVE
jgi:hypothetical protein